MGFGWQSSIGTSQILYVTVNTINNVAIWSSVAYAIHHQPKLKLSCIHHGATKRWVLQWIFFPCSKGKFPCWLNNHMGAPIMFTREPKMVTTFWAFNSISSKQVFLRYPFLEPHHTQIQSVRLRHATGEGLPILERMSYDTCVAWQIMDQITLINMA